VGYPCKLRLHRAETAVPNRGELVVFLVGVSLMWVSL